MTAPTTVRTDLTTPEMGALVERILADGHFRDYPIEHDRRYYAMLQAYHKLTHCKASYRGDLCDTGCRHWVTDLITSVTIEKLTEAFRCR